MTDATKLAESLRAMRRNAKPHWDLHGRPTRHSVTMDEMWLGDLSDAADLIEKQVAEIKTLKDVPAVLLTDEQIARALHAWAGYPEEEFAFENWRGDAEAEGLIELGKVTEAASLAANGKAVS